MPARIAPSVEIVFEKPSCKNAMSALAPLALIMGPFPARQLEEPGSGNGQSEYWNALFTDSSREPYMYPKSFNPSAISSSSSSE